MSALPTPPPPRIAPVLPFWRMDDPVKDEAGQVVRGGMWWHQRQWWDMPNFIRGLVTGYGGGKTIALGKRMIYLALVNAPVSVITVSPTYPMALTTIVQTIDELLQGKKTIEHGFRYHLYRSQPYRFVIRYKGRQATILCMSGEKPDRLKGSNVAAGAIDEPFIQDRAVFDQVVARIRHPRAKRRELNLGGTPEGVVGWGFDLFEGELRNKHDVGLVQCSSRENQALPDDYVPRLESTFDEQARDAYVEGKFVNMRTGRVYHSFRQEMAEVDHAMPDGAQWGCGMDFNVNPMAFTVFWQKGERVHFVREFELPNSDTEAAGAELHAHFPLLRNVYPDASGNKRSTAAPGGRSDFRYLREAGFVVHAHSSNPPLRDRYNAVNGALKTGKVTISPACRKLRTYLLAYAHEDLNTKAQKAMSHLLDAFGYPIAYLLPAVRRQAKTVAFSGA